MRNVIELNFSHRSRNVFLRVTDGRKYCWYSAYAWSATGCMACFAVFAHFYLDSVHSKKRFLVADQETIGKFYGVVKFTSLFASFGSMRRLIDQHLRHSDFYERILLILNYRLGWLGIVIFFTPIACTIIIDIFFYVTTMQIINRMNTYGRIHHKLKSRYGKFYERI